MEGLVEAQLCEESAKALGLLRALGLNVPAEGSVLQSAWSTSLP